MSPVEHSLGNLQAWSWSSFITYCDLERINIPKPQLLHLQHRAKNALWRLRQEDCRELSLETPHSASWNLKYTDKLTVYIVHNAQPRDGQITV